MSQHRDLSHRPTRCARIIAAPVGALCAIAFGPAASPVAADTLEEALRLVTADTVGAVIVADLKRANDELTLCLERMDRPEAFFVGRPIDLVKAQLGLSVGVRDTGALVVLLRWPDGIETPRPVTLVPVSDAAAFLTGNFVIAEDGAMRNAAGNRVHTRELGKWVAISPVSEGVEGLASAADGDSKEAERLRHRLGERAITALRGELLAWIDGEALRRMAAGAGGAAWDGIAQVPRALLPIQIGPESIARFLAGLDIAALSIDLDALAATAHGAVRYDEASDLGAALRRPQRAMRSLGRLPSNPPYWAVSIDLDDFGPALREFIFPEAEGSTPLRDAFAGVRGVQWGCWPSRLGVAVGGILNDSSALLVTDDPEALRARVGAMVLDTEGDHDGLRIEPQLERDRVLRSGGSADAFELRETPVPGALDPTTLAMRNALRTALFGNRGVHGLLRTAPDGVIVTFSQRPDVLGRATEAGMSAPALDTWPVIVAMREFMVDRPSIEAYLGLGELSRVLRQLAGNFGGEAAAMIPTLDAGAEPIGMAIAVDDATIMGSTVVPAGVLGAILDEVQRQRR